MATSQRHEGIQARCCRWAGGRIFASVFPCVAAACRGGGLCGGGVGSRVGAAVDSTDEMGVCAPDDGAGDFTSRASEGRVSYRVYHCALQLTDGGCEPMSGRSVIFGVAYVGKMSLNFLFFRLNACDATASWRFCSSVVLTAPAVILMSVKGQQPINSLVAEHEAEETGKDGRDGPSGVPPKCQ
jgi:hypothetical protein